MQPLRESGCLAKDTEITTTEHELPDAAEMQATISHVVDAAPRAFLWDYTRSRPQLVTL